MEDYSLIASRMFVAIFGIAWWMLAGLDIEMGQRDLMFSLREWTYLVLGLAGISLVVLSCLPNRWLASGVARSIFLPLILLVEFAILLVAYRNLSYLQRGVVALVAVLLGILLALSARNLLWQQRQSHRQKAAVR